VLQYFFATPLFMDASIAVPQCRQTASDTAPAARDRRSRAPYLFMSRRYAIRSAEAMTYIAASPPCAIAASSCSGSRQSGVRRAAYTCPVMMASRTVCGGWPSIAPPFTSDTLPLQVAKDNGAKRALIPIENKRNFLDVSADIMEHVDPVFYGDPKTVLPDEFEPVSEWTVTRPLFRTEATPLSKSSGAVEFEIGSR